MLSQNSMQRIQYHYLTLMEIRNGNM